MPRVWLRACACCCAWGLVAMTVTTAGVARGQAQAPGHEQRLGDIAFHPCEIERKLPPATVHAACARFAVPERSDAPQGRQIELNMALVHARNPRAQPDMLVLLAGGPGQGAVDSYPQIARAFEPVLQDRDLLLIDQRGTGESAPLRCDTPADNAAGTAVTEQWRAAARACLQQLSPHADPAWYTTVDAVQDLERVRQALGAPQFDLVGVSYGTRVALEYLREYPQGVRSLVLDGVVPPELALGEHFARNLDAALDQVFAHCRNDAACHAHFGDPAVTLANLRTRLAHAPGATDTASLRDPQTGEWINQPLTLGDLVGVARMYAYQSEAAALLPLMLDEAAHGHPQSLIAQARLLSRDMNDALALGMQWSVDCAEDIPWMRPDPADRQRLLGSAIYDGLSAACQEWPHRSLPDNFKSPVSSDKPALLLSGEWDPVTPPAYAEQVAAHLPNARTLVAAGQGHNVLPHGCMPRVLAHFIINLDPLTFKAPCLDDLRATPPFLSAAGPAP